MEKTGRIPVKTQVDLDEKKRIHRKDKRVGLKTLLPRGEDMDAPSLWLFLWVLAVDRRAHIHL